MSAGFVMTVCALMLLGGFLLKARCTRVAWDGDQYARLCYNDIQPLYGARGIDRNEFPYVDGGLRAGELEGGAIEYPVLTGLFMWASGTLVSTADSYLVVSALLLAPLGLLVAYLLYRMVGARALLWAGAPAIVLYAFHNWDLLVVASAVAGIYAWRSRKDLWAALWFGVGGGFKLFPILFVAPLVVERWRAGDRRRAGACLGVAVGALTFINLPFAIVNPGGWWATYEFHAERFPNYDTIWSVGIEGFNQVPPSPEFLNPATAGLIAGSLLVALLYGWRKAHKPNAYPFVQVCGAMLVAFLLWNKVHSPQYALWLLPFFSFLNVNLIWWIAYTVTDLIVYVGVFRWFYDLGLSQDMQELTLAKAALISGVWARAALLVGLFVAFLRAEPVWEAGGPGTTVLSQGSSKVGPVGERLAPG